MKNYSSSMSSDAKDFEDTVDSLKEFVDEDGHHYYIIQFKDDSGRVFRKKRSEDETSIAEFVIRDQHGMEAMRQIASATDFEFDGERNTRQNLRNLMNGN